MPRANLRKRERKNAPSSPVSEQESNPRRTLVLKLIQQLLDEPGSDLQGPSSLTSADLIFDLYDQSAVLASTGAPADTPVFFPPILPPDSVSSDRKNTGDTELIHKLFYRQILCNLRQARLNLTTADRDAVLTPALTAGATSFTPTFPLKASAGSSKGKEPAQGRPGDPALRAKLNQCLDALRRARQALRLRKHVEERAARAQAAIAKHTAEGQTAPRALRDYRHRANTHVTQIGLLLDDLITRTAEIEGVPPTIPGRHSPPSVTPATLGEPPISDPVTSAPATDLPDFSRPFASELTPFSKKASKAANQSRRDPDEEDFQDTRPSRRSRRHE